MDWTLNNIPIGTQILDGYTATQSVPTGQLTSSAQTLRDTIDEYPHAQFEVYGHSLGSMDAQYAVAILEAADVGRIDGAYVHEGPNMYAFLN